MAVLMVTSSVAVGTAAGFQLPAVNQSVDTVPSQAGLAARAGLASNSAATAVAPSQRARGDMHRRDLT